MGETPVQGSDVSIESANHPPRHPHVPHGDIDRHSAHEDLHDLTYRGVEPRKTLAGQSAGPVSCSSTTMPSGPVAVREAMPVSGIRSLRFGRREEGRKPG